MTDPVLIKTAKAAYEALMATAEDLLDMSDLVDSKVCVYRDDLGRTLYSTAWDDTELRLLQTKVNTLDQLQKVPESASPMLRRSFATDDGKRAVIRLRRVNLSAWLNEEERMQRSTARKLADLYPEIVEATDEHL